MVSILKSHIGNNGLGNLMFTIATGEALSIRDGKQMYITKPNGYNEYSDNIFRNIKVANEIPNNIYREKSFTYSEIPVVDAIDGYFQSEKYFCDYEDFIYNLFAPSDEIQEYINNKYSKILNNSTSIHVRRGDYIKFQDKHPICSVDYYLSAIEEIGEYKFVVFSDDIDWCKSVFEGDAFTFIEGEKDWMDLYLMSQCKNNIIANSSFSWWAAWLNRNISKKIIAPKTWFGQAINHDTSDLIPNRWRKI